MNINTKDLLLIQIVTGFLGAVLFTILGTCLEDPYSNIFLWLTIIPTLISLIGCWKYIGEGKSK